MKKFLLILAAALTLSACAEQIPGQVKVTGGTIEGTVLEDMTVYKGIPFAAPPVGELRWKAPQPVVAWDGVLDLTHADYVKEWKPEKASSGSVVYTWTKTGVRSDVCIVVRPYVIYDMSDERACFYGAPEIYNP